MYYTPYFQAPTSIRLRQYLDGLKAKQYHTAYEQIFQRTTSSLEATDKSIEVRNSICNAVYSIPATLYRPGLVQFPEEPAIVFPERKFSGSTVLVPLYIPSISLILKLYKIAQT